MIISFINQHKLLFKGVDHHTCYAN